MKNNTNITSKTDKIDNFVEEYILNQESCALQEDMYNAFQSAFLEKNVFVQLTHKQTTDINNTIKKSLQRYFKRIQKDRKRESA